jgi:transcriptional regulator with XRE-family HTH domain
MKCTMTALEQEAQRRELGDFVRSLREKLAPAELGLPAGARRRTPGLRREEVAQLSGLSVTWYTWLEQGRDMSLSPSALSRLANALRLGRAERAYLFELARRRDPDHGAGEIDELPAAVASCVGSINAPAYVLDQSWTARSWNSSAERLFVGWLDQPGHHNLLRFIFLEPGARSLIRDFENRARRVVAEFRADVSAHLNDPAVRLLVSDLGRHSRDFARFWNEHSVLAREGGERTFNHPVEGLLGYEQVTFALVGRPRFKLTILLPR